MISNLFSLPRSLLQLVAYGFAKNKFSLLDKVKLSKYYNPEMNSHIISMQG